MNNVIKKITGIFAALGFLAPQLAHAQTQTALGEVSNFGEFISLVWSYGSQVIIVLAVLLIVLGAFFYISSAGDEEKIKQGKEMIFGSFMAIVIVIFSGVLIRTLHKPAEGTTGTLSDIPNVINNATNILVSVIGAFTVFMIVYSGLMYVTARGNADKIEKATRSLHYATYGLVIGVLSYTLVNSVVDYFI